MITENNKIKFRALNPFTNTIIEDVSDLTVDQLLTSELVPLRYSGIKDDNGEEIYEHDIVRGIGFDQNEYFIAKIEFKSGAFVTLVNGWATSSDLGGWAIEIIRIGSIYEKENKELYERYVWKRV